MLEEWNQGNAVFMGTGAVVDVEDADGLHFNAQSLDGPIDIFEASRAFAAWHENKDKRTVRVRQLDQYGAGAWLSVEINAAEEPDDEPENGGEGGEPT